MSDKITDAEVIILNLGQVLLAMAKHADQHVIASRSREEVDLYRSVSGILQTGAEECMKIASDIRKTKLGG